MNRVLPALLVLAIVGLAGAALATPDPGNTLFACATHGDGWLRLVDGPESCAQWEEAVSWNQAGPTGPSCTVVEKDEGGFTMTCPDGTSVTWFGSEAEANSDSQQSPTIDCTRRRPEPAADMSGCDLSGIDLSGAFLYQVDLSGADLSGADLSNSSLWEVNLMGANLSHTNLSNADLTAVDASGAILDGADLTNAAGEDVDLTRASLLGADGGDSGFTVGTFSEADLRFADLSNADLREADFRDADLGNTILWSADLSGADLTGARGLDTAVWGDTTCPDGSESGPYGAGCVGHLTPTEASHQLPAQ